MHWRNWCTPTSLMRSRGGATGLFEPRCSFKVAMLGLAVILAMPALVAYMNSACEGQMKTCLEKKGYTYPKKTQ
jgi:hypothetical protein